MQSVMISHNVLLLKIVMEGMMTIQDMVKILKEKQGLVVIGTNILEEYLVRDTEGIEMTIVAIKIKNI